MKHTVPSDRLAFTADGHADPAQLIDVMSDADTRTADAGLTYLAGRTAVPAAFSAEPDAPCASYVWCVETGAHIEHLSRRVSLPATDGLPPILTAHIYADEECVTPELNFDPGHDDWREGISGDQLRAEVSRVRAHLVRLDAFADQYDAIREAGDDDRAGQASASETSAPAPVSATVSVPAVRVRPKRLGDGTPAALRDTTKTFDLAIDFSHPPADIAAALQALFEEAVETRRWTRRQAAAEGRDAYVPPTDWDDAAEVRAAGAQGAFLKAYLFTPREVDGEPIGPQVLSVSHEDGADVELDHAGAVDLRNQVAELLPKLDVMVAALASAEQKGNQR